MYNSSSASSSSSSSSNSRSGFKGTSEEDAYRLHCEEVIRHDPHNEDAHLHLALWHAERKNFSLARRYMQHLTILQESNVNFDTWLLLSLCCSMDNQIEEASACNRYAESFTPTLNQTQRFKLRYVQILLLERSKEYDVAFSQYNVLLQDVSEAIASNQKRLAELSSLSLSAAATSAAARASLFPTDEKGDKDKEEIAHQRINYHVEIDEVQEDLACQKQLREEVLVREAIIYKDKGVLEESRIICDNLLNENISNDCKINVLCLRGMIYELKKDLISAEKMYLEAATLKDFHPWVNERLGRIYLKYGQTIPAALQFLFNSVKANSVNSRTWYLLGRCYMANSGDHCDSCDYYSAYQAYTRAINLNPNDAQIWCSLGVLYYTFGQYRESLSHLCRAVKLQPNMPETWYNIGALYEMCEQPEDAQQAYDKARENGINERFELLGMKSFPPAIDPKQEESELSPSSSTVQNEHNVSELQDQLQPGIIHAATPSPSISLIHQDQEDECDTFPHMMIDSSDGDPYSKPSVLAKRTHQPLEEEE